jgi:four helix bundle protein
MAQTKLAKTFEELQVYQKARKLTNGVYKVSQKGPFARDYGLTDQVRRASVSVMSNIAEGFERGTRPEFIRFLFIAKGSCGELRAQLEIARDQEYLSEADHTLLRAQALEASGMISRFITRLRSGPRVNKKTVS